MIIIIKKDSRCLFHLNEPNYIFSRLFIHFALLDSYNWSPLSLLVLHFLSISAYLEVNLSWILLYSSSLFFLRENNTRWKKWHWLMNVGYVWKLSGFWFASWTLLVRWKKLDWKKYPIAIASWQKDYYNDYY